MAYWYMQTERKSLVSLDMIFMVIFHTLLEASYPCKKKMDKIVYVFHYITISTIS